MKRFLRKIRTLLRVLIGTDVLCRVEVECVRERFGSEYGGWWVATDRLRPASVVYSVGIGHDISFDLALIERFGLTVHAFDPTPKSIEWIGNQDVPSEFVLHKFGLAGDNGTARFFPPENPDHVSHTFIERSGAADRALSVPVRRLSSVLDQLGHERIDVLKLDIEGAEYDVIEDMATSDVRPEQLLVEFHHRFPEIDVDLTRKALETLRALGYRLFAISESNEEYCFLRCASEE